MKTMKIFCLMFIGLLCLLNSLRLHRIYKKEKKTFFEDEAGAPSYFLFFSCGVLLIIWGISVFLNE